MIGVEFAGELVEVARTNLAKRQIANAVVSHVDAADYDFPDSNLVVYLYNPFSQEVLRKVVANLKAGCSKRLYVIYKGAEIFDSSSFLRRFGSSPTALHIQIWSAVG